MDTPPDWSRRALLSTTTLTGVAALSGCLGTTDVTALAGAGDSSRMDHTTANEQCLTDWLDGTNGYDGHTERYGPDAKPTVDVGTSPTESDTHRAFDPAVVRVVPGTTVTWEWTGHGGSHNVVALDGAFDSGRAVDGTETSFEHTFEAVGTHRYVSEPNREAGMRGLVEVAEPPSSEYPSVDEWLASVERYDGTIPDHREFPATTITVGSAAGPDAFDFAPVAVKVSPETTVTWVWSGDGGPHNVAFEDHDVGLDAVETAPGVHFEHTFDEPGVYRYACEPHETLGQRGAIVVETRRSD